MLKYMFIAFLLVNFLSVTNAHAAEEKTITPSQFHLDIGGNKQSYVHKIGPTDGAPPVAAELNPAAKEAAGRIGNTGSLQENVREPVTTNVKKIYDAHISYYEDSAPSKNGNLSNLPEKPNTVKKGIGAYRVTDGHSNNAKDE